MIQIMAMDILRSVIKQIQCSNFYSILADETSDISNVEQLAFCIRSVDKNLKIREDFIGVHECDETTGLYLVKVPLHPPKMGPPPKG